MLILDESTLEPLPLDGLEVPCIRLFGPPPYTEAKLGKQEYRYERSYPVQGHSANLPNFIREQIAAGKSPLLIEREDRFYVYLNV